MVSTPADERAEARWVRFWTATPHVLLAVSTALSLAPTDRPWSSRLLTLGLAATTAAWMWYVVPARCAWSQRLVPMLGYFAVLLGLTGLLLVRDLGFALFVIGVFIQVLTYLPGPWAYGGVVATAGLLVVGTARGRSVDLIGYLPGFLVNVVLVSAIGFFIRSTALQSERRKHALAELAGAHARLADYAEENAQLQAKVIAQAREAGVRAERARLAGEIHDTLAQGLAGIITQLEAAERAVPDPDAARRLAIARDLARESLVEARRSVQALRPESLEGAQLPDAVTSVADRWTRAHGVPADVTVTGTSRPLHPEVEVTLLRAAQEALANVARHARAGKAGLTLSYMEDVVVLDVRDDGVGFDPDTHTTGFGLVAMRQRVTSLGGTLTVESTPGHGTAISASVMAIPTGSTR